MFDLLWTQLISFDETSESQTLRCGLTEYSIFGLLQKSGKEKALEKRFAHIENVVGKNRPAQSWRRWKNKAIPHKERGFGFFYMLSSLCGPHVMNTVFHDFVVASQKGAVTPLKALEQSVASNCKRDFHWLFSQYLSLGFLPDFVIEEARIQELRRPVNLLYDHYGNPSDSGRYTTEVRLSQVGEIRFRGKVDLLVETDTDRYDSQVDFDSRRQTVKIITSRPPRKITLDPYNRFLDCRDKNNSLSLDSKSL